MSDKVLLLVAHDPSENLRRMTEAVLRGARSPEIEGVRARHVRPLEAVPEDVLGADALVLLTPENLGYMSGALKDFFDRIYYPCLEETIGRPYALVIRAKHDGTGTRRGVETIVRGLQWKRVQEPLLCHGDWRDEWLDACEELGMAMAAGLEVGVF